MTLVTGPGFRATPAPVVAGRHRDVPRRLTSRIGPFRLHTGPALLVFDVLACLSTFAVVRGDVWTLVAQTATTILICVCLHLYRPRLSLRALDDVPGLLAALLVGFLTGVALDVGDGLRQNLLVSSALFAALVGSRLASFAIANRVRRTGDVSDLAVIIGAGHVGIQLGKNLQQHREYGVTPVGYIDSNPRIAEGEQLPAPLLGGYRDLATVIEDFSVAYVMVAFGALREEALVDILRTCDRLNVNVCIVPRLFELHNSNRDTDNIWGIPLLRVRRAAFRSRWWRAKRGLDVLISGVSLLVLSPILAACAAAVRWEGGPGVVFRQVRVGLDERPFNLLKFRSLKPVDDDESSTNWNIQHDARLGPVGRFLRRSSLDELPQLWNILRGDMSLVGPRPERPHFVNKFSGYIPRYTARHRVPAGLTGWAQIHGLRGDTSIEHRATFDNYYIENWSVWLDLKILARTVSQVIQRRGA